MRRVLNQLGFGRITLIVALGAATIMCSTASAVDLIGYLPSYRMNSSYNSGTLIDQLPLLDEIRYFGLTANNSGAIVSLPENPPVPVQTHYNNIATLKSLIASLPADQRPRLDITLGGAGQQTSFANIAGSASLRNTFAQSVTTLLDDTGATSVDIDWEHPSSELDAVGSAQRENYSLMVRGIKEKFGASRRVYATITPEIFMPKSAIEGDFAIDGVSLMTYDLGWWGNDPQNPNQFEHSLPEYAEDAVDAWTKSVNSAIPAARDWVFKKWGNSYPASVLGVGLPFYGRDVVDDHDNNDEDEQTYAALMAGSTASDGNYFTYDGESMWLPGLDLVQQRIEFANEAGLKNVIIWEIGQDLHPDNDKSLLRKAYETNQSFLPVIPGDYDHSGAVGPEDYNLWKSRFGATTGDMRADGNQDGVIDAADYTFWRDRVPLGSGTGAAVSIVPEPSTLLQLGLLGGIGTILYRRRGSRSLA